MSQARASNSFDGLPPHSAEAERGVLGCCLLDPGKTAEAIKAGVTSRWFYELRQAELFRVLAQMAADGGQADENRATDVTALLNSHRMGEAMRGRIRADAQPIFRALEGPGEGRK